MLTPVEFDAYLKRVQTEQVDAVDLDCLKRLHFAHATCSPFENMDSLSGLPVRLDLFSLVQKLVYEQRGGYCFEQNLLMAGVLETAGFTVSRLAARPLWHLPGGKLPEPLVTGLPRSHMLLLVTIEDAEWLVDVGFGGLTPLGPIALTAEREQLVLHDTFRVITHVQGYVLQALIKGQWKSMYVFDRQEQQQADLEMMNYWVNTSAESRFTQSLILALPHAKGRHAFINTALTNYDWNGKERRKVFRETDKILDVLETTFGLQLSGMDVLRQKIRQLLEADAG
jgi:N-hydroxyarylamine O-acetyltransferase